MFMFVLLLSEVKLVLLLLLLVLLVSSSDRMLSFSLNVLSRDEVDETLCSLEDPGGGIVKKGSPSLLAEVTPCECDLLWLSDGRVAIH
jgi:hypothetical protein